MQITVTVGTHERHEVVYRYHQFTGRTRITVDGRTVVDTIRQWSPGQVKRRALTVGVHEVHHVVISKRIPVLFPAFRSQQVTVQVDGRIVAHAATSAEAGDFSPVMLYVAVGISLAALGLLIALPVLFVFVPLLL